METADPTPPFTPQDYLRAQALLLRVERLNAMSSLGSGVAHDLKNLIGVVKNYALLMDQDLKDGRGAEPGDVDAILEASGQAVAVAQALMTFGGRDEDPDQDFDLAERLVRVGRILAPVMPPAVRVATELGEGPFPLRGDPRRVDQVFVSLGLNALEAMPTGGTLTLRLARELEGDRPWARWEVVDTGFGVPAEMADKVFLPFVTTKPESGSGLGLAAVRAVVRHFRGRVDLGPAPGQGTCVTVRLPLERRIVARGGGEGPN